MIVASGTYELQGTPPQQAILAECFLPGSASYIAFPWERLSPPAKPIPIGWMDLNAAYAVSMRHVPVYLDDPAKIPGHVHIEDEAGNEGHAVTRMIDARRWIAGVFWTDGRIYIDTRCEAQPELAREVVSAELAHSVDYFLPLAEEQKTLLMALWHSAGSDAHSWWEKIDYGGEYYDLGGEAFMAAFTSAYSAIEPDQSAFTHKTTREQAGDVRAIIGVSEEQWLRIGRGRRYHRETCWVVRVARALKRDVRLTDGTEFTPCRICRPQPSP